jgi:hypothetical protein
MGVAVLACRWVTRDRNPQPHRERPQLPGKSVSALEAHGGPCLAAHDNGSLYAPRVELPAAAGFMTPGGWADTTVRGSAAGLGAGGRPVAGAA